MAEGSSDTAKRRRIWTMVLAFAADIVHHALVATRWTLCATQCLARRAKLNNVAA